MSYTLNGMLIQENVGTPMPSNPIPPQVPALVDGKVVEVIKYPGSFQYLVNETIIWGRERKIIQNSTSRAQASKCLEEVDELLDHTSRLNELKEAWQVGVTLTVNEDYLQIVENVMESLHKKIKDDIGDILVTLIMVAEIESLDLTECLAAAYDEIKDRKGYLGNDGKFHKQ